MFRKEVSMISTLVDIILAAAVGAAFVFALRKSIRDQKSGKCCGECGAGSACRSCADYALYKKKLSEKKKSGI